MKVTSCGVLVTDGARLLLAHATRSRRWDIPKGIAREGEDFLSAAVRELWEETGIQVNAEALLPLGIYRYLPAKDLALFQWQPDTMPDPARLRCTSRFAAGDRLLPECDRYGLFYWDEAVSLVGRNLARILKTVRRDGTTSDGSV